MFSQDVNLRDRNTLATASDDPILIHQQSRRLQVHSVATVGRLVGRNENTAGLPWMPPELSNPGAKQFGWKTFVLTSTMARSGDASYNQTLPN